jgi:carbon storage regulator
MLIVRRRSGESLLIGDQVEIEILDLGASHVKLGIRAPREITVLRKEVQLTREANRTAATSLSGELLPRLLGSFSSLSCNPSSSPTHPER